MSPSFFLFCLFFGGVFDDANVGNICFEKTGILISQKLGVVTIILVPKNMKYRNSSVVVVSKNGARIIME